MRWLIALVVVMVVGAAAAVVIVVAGERDTVPDELRACAAEAGARRIDGADSLGPLRVDLLRDTLAVDERVALRNDWRVDLLRPQDGSYTAIAAQSDTEPERPVIATIRTRPSLLAFVAYGEGAAGEALEACVESLR